MIVAKFGGSSCANSKQFKKVRQIVDMDKDRKIIVVSAPGKHTDDNFKITDTLFLCYQLSREQLDANEIFEQIADRFRSIHQELKLKVELEDELEKIRKKLLSAVEQDYIVSRGEYLNAILMADYLDFEFADAKDLLRFDKNKKFDKEASYKLMAEFLKKRKDKNKGIVVPGFYGADNEGNIITFPRGGSDITGAILAAGFKADLYENWTDVSGFLVADPKIITNPKTIHSLSYNELRELSYSDSQIIQADAISPTREAGIPIQIKNTNSPDATGTIIQSEVGAKARLVTGIAGQKNFTVIHLKKYNKNEDYGFMRKICTIFEAHKITIHHLPTSIDTVSIISHIDDNKELEQIIEQIRLYCKPDQSSFETSMALITIVGESMAYQPGIAGKIFSALGASGVNIRMITQGASEYNIIIGVEDSQYNLAMQTLHDYFFQENETEQESEESR